MEKTEKKPDSTPPSSSGFPGMSMIMTAIAVLGTLLSLIVALGAGKLSYDKNGSYAWALLATVFAPFYYPYYAYFVSTSSVTTMFGGGRRRR